MLQDTAVVTGEGGESRVTYHIQHTNPVRLDWNLQTPRCLGRAAYEYGWSLGIVINR